MTKEGPGYFKSVLSPKQKSHTESDEGWTMWKSAVYGCFLVCLFFCAPNARHPVDSQLNYCYFMQVIFGYIITNKMQSATHSSILQLHNVTNSGISVMDGQRPQLWTVGKNTLAVNRLGVERVDTWAEWSDSVCVAKQNKTKKQYCIERGKNF